jgi:hypothetical protein
MNKRDYVLAVKAGWIKEAGEPDAGCLNLEQFADLIRADEREACAKVCENGINNATDWDSSAWDQACENRAWAIRARGNT